MRLIESKVEIELNEIETLSYALHKRICDTIKSHWKHLQNKDNNYKRSSFFEYEKADLYLLKKLCDSCDRSHLYECVINTLNIEIPKVEE